MREWAKHIYQSKQWKSRVRAYIIDRDNGLCVHCHKPGSVVHHKVWLTPRNVNDPSIVYGEDNLELVCEKCHGMIHEGEQPVDNGLMFDEHGNLIERT